MHKQISQLLNVNTNYSYLNLVLISKIDGIIIWRFVYFELNFHRIVIVSLIFISVLCLL